METEVNPVFGGMVALGVMVLVAGAFATCCVIFAGVHELITKIRAHNARMR